MTSSGDPIPLQPVDVAWREQAARSSERSIPGAFNREDQLQGPEHRSPSACLTPPLNARSSTATSSTLTPGPPSSTGSAHTGKVTANSTWQKWLLIAKTIAPFLAAAGVIAALIALFPSFKSNDIDRQSLEITKWAAWEQFIDKCKEKAKSGVPLSLNCRKALHADEKDEPPPYSAPANIFSRTLHSLPLPHFVELETLFIIALSVTTLALCYIVFRSTFLRVVEVIRIVWIQSDPATIRPAASPRSTAYGSRLDDVATTPPPQSPLDHEPRSRHRPQQSTSRSVVPCYQWWWLPAEGIAREVISADIQRWLGNNARVRQHGVDGYWIWADRDLTSAMIEDLKADTAAWRQYREREAEGHYGNSAATSTASTRQFARSGYPTHSGNSSQQQVSDSYAQHNTVTQHQRPSAPYPHPDRQYWGPTSHSEPSSNVHSTRTHWGPSSGAASNSVPSRSWPGYQQQGRSTYSAPASGSAYSGQQAQATYSAPASGSAYSAQQAQSTNSATNSGSAPRGYSYSQSAQNSGYAYSTAQPSSEQQPQPYFRQRGQQPLYPSQIVPVRLGYYLASDGRQYPMPMGSVAADNWSTSVTTGQNNAYWL